MGIFEFIIALHAIIAGLGISLSSWFSFNRQALTLRTPCCWSRLMLGVMFLIEKPIG